MKLFIDLEWPYEDHDLETLIVNKLEIAIGEEPCFNPNANFSPYHRGVYSFAIRKTLLSAFVTFCRTILAEYVLHRFNIQLDYISFIRFYDGNHCPANDRNYYSHYIYSIDEVETKSIINVNNFWYPIIKIDPNTMEFSSDDLSRLSFHKYVMEKSTAMYNRLKEEYGGSSS